MEEELLVQILHDRELQIKLSVLITLGSIIAFALSMKKKRSPF